MPEPLKSENIIVLFADLQKGIVENSQTNPERHIAHAAKALATIAKVLDIPVLVLGVDTGHGQPKMLSEITDTLPHAPVHVRRTARAMHEEATRTAIAASGRNTLWLVGVASEIVVHHAALDALADGYRVQVLTDATGGMSERGEDASFRTIERAGGEIVSLASVATAVAGDFTTDRGKAVLAAIVGMR